MYSSTLLAVSPLTISSIHQPPLVVQPDVHDMGVAEQVVQIPEGFLVGPDQERGQVVRLARHELVHLKGALGRRADERSGRSCRPSRR